MNMPVNDALRLRERQITDALTREGIAARLEVSDAPEALAFLTSQLAYVEAKVYEKKRQPMQYQKLVPVSTEAGEAADSIEYETYDYVGRGKKHSGKAGDIPRVDVAIGRKSLSVMTGAIGYDYSMQELRASALLRRPLPERRANVAMEAYERHINDVALNGESSSNYTGLFNNASVTYGNVAAGAATTLTWATKTPLEILKDINAAMRTVWENSQYNEVVDTVVIAPEQFAYIATTPMSSTIPDKTILDYIKEHNLSKVNSGVNVDFQPGYGLNGAGAGSTDRFMVYVKNENNVKMHLPMPIKFLAPQMEGLSVFVPGEYRYGQVHFYYPGSALYQDGI